MKKSAPEQFPVIPWQALTLLFLIAIGNAGCAQLLYYAQATQGQLEVMNRAKSIDIWLADSGTQSDLKQRLARAQQIRQFAVNELSLPDNRSYTRYADLKRQYVLWNVIATPELSMQPVRWCFPVAGCVDYRGYYKREEAERFADKLRIQGYDVHVAGVPAYSTLGWFNDPLLSTFINYPDAELARLLFHELAHQIAYAPNDTPFNEAFATTVERIGVQRWLNLYGDDDARAHYRDFRNRKSDFTKLLSEHRRQLESVYTSDRTDADKRVQKALVISSLQASYRKIKQEKWGSFTGYDAWFVGPITNAHLALVATYEEMVPVFETLFARSGSLPRFYAEVRSLAKQPAAERQRQLAALKAVTSLSQPPPTAGWTIGRAPVRESEFVADRAPAAVQ